MKRISKNKAFELVKTGALLVDMRSPVSFRDGHVVGAVNLPLRNFVNRIMPMNKATKIIIYSDDITDDVLRQGNNYAEGLGFTNVFVADYKSLTEETHVKASNKEKVATANSRKGHKRNPQGKLLLRNRR